MAFVVFAGQSNMGGLYMDASTLSKAWTASPLTQIWDSQSKSWVTMQPGVNTGYSGQPNTWGPEVQFAIDFRAAFPNEVLQIVKEVDGGTPLNQDTAAWHYDWSPNSANELFARTTSLIADASASLGGAHPTAVFWGQGEEDANTAQAAQAYGDNLSAFFSAVRAQWMADPTGKIGFFQIGATPAHAAEVRAGEVRVDQADPNAASFDTASYPLQGDGLHYAAAGYTAAGDNFFQLYSAWHAAGPGPSGGGGGGGGPPGQTLIAGQGGDTLNGGSGDDTMGGGAGPNYLWGQDGNDSIYGGAAFDNINGNKGDDTIDGGSGGDDWLVGGQGNDVITAHTGGNILYGNIGNDTLNGGSGSEILRGGQGDDVIYGGAGNDWLSGDRGSDTVTGGAGADIFHSFAGAGLDRVTDFNQAEGDQVQLDAGTTYAVSQVGADIVIDMGNGDQLVLANVQLASLQPGWLFQA
ncbi:MAG: alkaline metalloproteinase [Phenylobacterium sp.]|nr:alkaline metalloproteinase [Phenylobacterium sp.]